MVDPSKILMYFPDIVLHQLYDLLLLLLHQGYVYHELLHQAVI